MCKLVKVELESFCQIGNGNWLSVQTVVKYFPLTDSCHGIRKLSDVIIIIRYVCQVFFLGRHLDYASSGCLASNATSASRPWQIVGD